MVGRGERCLGGRRMLKGMRIELEEKVAFLGSGFWRVIEG